MLNIFPIQFLAPVAYALLRVCVGILLVRFGMKHIRNRESLTEIFSFKFFKHGLFVVWYLGIFELVVGLLFIAGLFTQVAALLSMIFSFKMIILHKHFTHPLIPARIFYVLFFVVSLSLFITGAGVFAFDLPI